MVVGAAEKRQGVYVCPGWLDIPCEPVRKDALSLLLVSLATLRVTFGRQRAQASEQELEVMEAVLVRTQAGAECRPRA